jgi:hypothetical protein
MKISKKYLEWAAGQGVLSTEQVEKLWNCLEANQAQRPHFSAARAAYYFGALIVISAMGWVHDPGLGESRSSRVMPA